MKNQLLKVTAFVITASLAFSCSTKKTASNEMENAMPNMAHTDSTNSGSMSTPPSSMDNDMKRSMSSGMSKMKNMEMSGDVDKDFASMMILHHQSAIEMSEEEIANGKNADAKAMAQKMITMQKAEITSLEKFTGSNETTKAKSEHNDSDVLSKIMENMMDEMNGMQMSGDADKDFIMMMIPHHEGAKEMAEHQLKHGKNAELKTMAQKMITDQEKEIAELKAWQVSSN